MVSALCASDVPWSHCICDGEQDVKPYWRLFDFGIPRTGGGQRRVREGNDRAMKG
jgi:hypothetical protein